VLGSQHRYYIWDDPRGKPIGSKRAGYHPEILIEGAGAGVE